MNTETLMVQTVNIYMHAKNFQNIPSGLKVILCIQIQKILPWRGNLLRNLTSNYFISQIL